MAEINRNKMTVEMEGEFVVFLLGIRINKFWKFHKWLPVYLAMNRMIGELQKNPDYGFLGFEKWYGRTILLVQYWKSVDHLLEYAQNKNAVHTPSWLNFNDNIRKSGDVGLWHETYISQKGKYECVYTNMPRFGLANIGNYILAKNQTHSARGRLGLLNK